MKMLQRLGSEEHIFLPYFHLHKITWPVLNSNERIEKANFEIVDALK